MVVLLAATGGGTFFGLLFASEGGSPVSGLAPSVNVDRPESTRSEMEIRSLSPFVGLWPLKTRFS